MVAFGLPYLEWLSALFAEEKHFLEKRSVSNSKMHFPSFSAKTFFPAGKKCCKSGLPDFSYCMIPNPKKCTKLTQNVPNGHKISQISINYSKWS
jgi:hypothetical protein